MSFFTKITAPFTYLSRACRIMPERTTTSPANMDTTLDLSNHDVSNTIVEESTQIVAATQTVVPQETPVKYVHLSNMNLGSKTDDEIKEILKNISKSATTLNLSHNNLDSKGLDSWKGILQTIPKSVTTLDLSSNLIASKGAAYFKSILENMPDSVKELDLSNNGLELIQLANDEDLSGLFSTIKPSVTTLRLSKHEDITTEDGLYNEKLYQLLESIPESVTKILLNEEKFTPTKSPDSEQIMLNSIKFQPQPYTMEQLKVSAAVMPGLFFSGAGSLVRPEGFDKGKLQLAMSCLLKGNSGNEGKTKINNLPEDVALDKIGKFLTPKDVSRLLQTCKPTING